jgi:sugar/nucleoside kinase (ribokinase family)
MTDILVVGSVAWDEVALLDSPLQRGSHNGARWLGRRVGGGAANTAMALARAGDRATVISALGMDDEGARLIAVLSELGVDVSAIDRQGSETTRSVILLESDGERTVVNLARARVPLPGDLAIRPAACCYVRSADPALTEVLRERVRHGLVVAHIPPLVPDFRPAQVLLGSASDLDADFLSDPYAAALEVAGEPLEWVVVTRGAAGACACAVDRTIEVRAPKVEAVDTTGAGDVFAAGLVHALARGQAMEHALATAVAWGAASVTFEGTVPPIGFPSLGNTVV